MGVTQDFLDTDDLVEPSRPIIGRGAYVSNSDDGHVINRIIFEEILGSKGFFKMKASLSAN